MYWKDMCCLDHYIGAAWKKQILFTKNDKFNMINSFHCSSVIFLRTRSICNNNTDISLIRKTRYICPVALKSIVNNILYYRAVKYICEIVDT